MTLALTDLCHAKDNSAKLKGRGVAMCLFACQGHGSDLTRRVAHWPSMCPRGHVCVCLYVRGVCRDRDHIVPLLLLDILKGRKGRGGGEGGDMPGNVEMRSSGSDLYCHKL